jgi:formylglycine-generating enzyme required for sulfatase activity
MDLEADSCEISFAWSTFSVDAGKEEHPVMHVTWYAAAAYCDWLSLKEGLPRAYNHTTWLCNSHDPYNAQGYRLPTEAEWEYACRGGTQTPFYTGNCLDSDTEANYCGEWPYPGCSSGSVIGWTVPVGCYPANTYGLYDMHGNLFEWCNEWYGSYSGDESDPVGPVTGSGRVIRGGFWLSDAMRCRSANRGAAYSEISRPDFGFRPVRSFD